MTYWIKTYDLLYNSKFSIANQTILWYILCYVTLSRKDRDSNATRVMADRNHFGWVHNRVDILLHHGEETSSAISSTGHTLDEKWLVRICLCDGWDCLQPILSKRDQSNMGLVCCCFVCHHDCWLEYRHA